MGFKSIILAVCINGLPLVTLAEQVCRDFVKLGSSYPVYNDNTLEQIGTLNISTASEMVYIDGGDDEGNKVAFAIMGDLDIKSDCKGQMEKVYIYECAKDCAFSVLPVTWTSNINTSMKFFEDEGVCQLQASGFFQMQSGSSGEPYYDVIKIDDEVVDFDAIDRVFDSACEEE